MMVSNPELFTRVNNIFNSQNFHKTLRETVDFLKTYSTRYNSLPDPDQIKATTGISIEHIEDMSDAHSEWFLDEFESFTKRKELERAILESADLLERGEYEPVEKKIKDAVQISLQKDLGTDYFADPRARLMKIKSSNGQVSTGWKVLDNKLYGGFNRGELNIFAGGSGSGKSLFMQNLAVNWSQMGLNGVYITLELSEELCSMRLDAMVADVNSKNIFKELENVELKVKMAGKRSGKFRIKYMPAQSNINDIRAYCKELQIQTDMKIDFLCVDYLDLLMPVSVKVSPSDQFIKDKYVSEELRNLSKELNVVLVTASQLNRSAVEEIEFDHSHIAGGISKINTADNLFGIFTSRSMRERGQYQLQLMKTRSSNGVGQKIDLDFNIETLRIMDNGSEEDGNSSKSASSSQSIMERLKPTSTTINQDTGELDSYEPQGKVVADVRGSQLRSLLNKLKT